MKISKAMTGEKNPNWKGGITLNMTKYKREYMWRYRKK